MSDYQTLISSDPLIIQDAVKVTGSISAALRSLGYNASDPRLRLAIKAVCGASPAGRHRHQYSVDDVRQAVESSTCMFDVLRQLGLPAVGGNSKTIQTLITINQIDTTHFNIREARRRNKTTWSVDAVLCEHSKYPRSNLARWVESANIFVYKCALCNNTGTWNGTILRLELDHINGISNDNRKENLRWLCPNCHSQTETFGGKNK